MEPYVERREKRSSRLWSKVALVSVTVALILFFCAGDFRGQSNQSAAQQANTTSGMASAGAHALTRAAYRESSR